MSEDSGKPKLAVDKSGGDGLRRPLVWEEGDDGRWTASVLDANGAVISVLRIQPSTFGGQFIAGTWTLLGSMGSSVEEMKERCQAFIDSDGPLERPWYPTLDDHL